MKVLSAKQMQDLDRRSIEEDQIDSFKLMEAAGLKSYQQIKKNKKACYFVFCGPGNNGGDGWLIAYHLHKQKYKVVVLSVKKPDSLKGDSFKAFQKYRKSGGSYQIYSQSFSLDSFFKSKEKLILIDSLFGTGLSRKLDESFCRLIKKINQSEAYTYSIDVPSGLDASQGTIYGDVVFADETISLGNPKTGFFLKKGPSCTGKLNIQDIGLSEKVLSGLKTDIYYVESSLFNDFRKKRKPQTHKGTYGHVFTIAGSQNKIGAGLLSTYAALKVGAGLSTLVCPQSAFTKVDTNKLELMYEPIPDNKKGIFLRKKLDQVLSIVDKASVVSIGPGLGLDPATVSFVLEFIKQYKGPLVCDADALNAIATKPSILKNRESWTYLTPHPAEMGRLIKKSTQFVQARRLQLAKEFAQKYGVDLCLKGYQTCIALSDGRVYVNSTGNPGMASAGQGDVLTGIAAGLKSQYPSYELVSVYAPYLHGKIGDQVKDKGQHVVLATDILNQLSQKRP